MRTREPAAAALIEALQDLRLALMREFGGHAVDFDVHCLPDTAAGDFAVTFAPVAAMEALPGGGTRNRATGQTAADAGLPRGAVGTVDSSNGKGNGMVYSREDWLLAVAAETGGRRLLERMMDFNALPGDLPRPERTQTLAGGPFRFRRGGAPPSGSAEGRLCARRGLCER